MAGMGIVILFMIFVCGTLFASLVVSALVAFGLIPLIYFIRKTPKDKRLSGLKQTLIMCVLCIGLSVTIVGLGVVGGGALLAASGGPAPLEDSLKLISLPSEAEVTKVEKGCWAGDFYVEFRMPATKPPEDWLTYVWALNSSKKKDFHDYKFRKETNNIGIYCFGVAHMSIAYDPKTCIYRFEHYFES
jgi:energy-coupling factor transporter transmembrane protein EcfT